MSLAPVTLPLTDVLTGLQTGLLDIVAMSPIGALVLQWHTKIKYVTEIPLAYTLGFMAIDKKAFSKLSEEDQMIVREVMERTYVSFDRANLKDNADARQALLNSGIESVDYDEEEVARIRELLLASNRRLGEQGKFDLDIYDEMLRLAQEYRDTAGAAAR
jgi:TRAP-type C4-dicarboxylate transport system substrate-binding protein